MLRTPRVGTRKWAGQVPITENIHFGTQHVITVKEGYIGLAFDRGTPRLLGPGMHQWDSPTVTWVDTFDMGQKVVHIGPFTFLVSFSSLSLSLSRSHACTDRS